MEAASSPSVVQVGNDLRLEMKVKNNVLWHAIHDHHGSVTKFCQAHPELGSWSGARTRIYCLLAFKTLPFKMVGEPAKIEYRSFCLLLERLLKVPVADLFPAHLYEHLVGRETQRVVEVSSFTALPGVVRQEIRLLTAPEEHSPEVQVDQVLLHDRIEEVLHTLPDPRMQLVVKLRLGLDGETEHTLEEIGERLGITRSRVAQIFNRAIRELKSPHRAKRLEAFLENV